MGQIRTTTRLFNRARRLGKLGGTPPCERPKAVENREVTPEGFRTLMARIRGDSDFKRDFFQNPVAAIRKYGVAVSEAYAESVRESFSAELGRSRPPQPFDEKLVLCSSSGY